ncbi:hypothetical protein Droror1_Dr00023595 [Drosera rotundifolia]
MSCIRVLRFQAEKISTVVKAAGVNVKAFWPSLFAKLVEKRNIEDLIMNVGAGGGGAPVAVAAAPAVGAAAALAAEEKKEEKKEGEGRERWGHVDVQFV